MANPQRQVGRVLSANFGVSHLTVSRSPGSSKMETINGAISAPWSPPTLVVGPPASVFTLTVLRSSSDSQGRARGAGGRRHRQPTPRRPPNGPAGLKITPWLAAGAPAPARRPPLQLAAKFMLAALQWRPQSARSIPTARLRAARPEGGVSGV